MRLVGYGAGELFDRLSILALKIAHKPDQHFLDEQSDLLDQIPSMVYRVPSREAFKHVLMLSATNARIWHLEDHLREMRSMVHPNVEETADIAATAMQIQQLNDNRAHLISVINQATGYYRGNEKVTS